jgi:predicted nucleic acid-binding protein
MSLLDSNIVIEHLKTKTIYSGYISNLTLVELLRGIREETREAVKTELEKLYIVIYLDNDAILEYCKLYNVLRKDGEIIPEFDLLIAAIAISKKIPLISKDTHFERMEKHGLILSKD